MKSDSVDEIIEQLKQLDIESYHLNARRTSLVTQLERTVSGNTEEKRPSGNVAKGEEHTPRNPFPFQIGDRVEISNKVTPSRKSVGITIGDLRGTVTRQTRSRLGQVKVFFNTDNDVNTHRLAKNLRKADKNCPYELARKQGLGLQIAPTNLHSSKNKSA